MAEKALTPVDRALARMNADDRDASQSEAKALARRLLDDAEYRESFMQRWRKGKVPAAVEMMIWHYAYGTPPKEINQKTRHSVRVEHIYADDRPKPPQLTMRAISELAADDTSTDISDAEILGQDEDSHRE